jgi:hypothetical protein
MKRLCGVRRNIKKRVQDYGERSADENQRLVNTLLRTALEPATRKALLLSGLLSFCLASKLFVCEPLAYNLPNETAKAISIAHRQAIVEPERLFVNITE